MVAKKIKNIMEASLAIREMFEEGRKLAALHGPENVCDFSLGNPSIPAPEAVNQYIVDIVQQEKSTVVHGYMNNAGYEDARTTIAESLNRKFGTGFAAKNIVMTVGAAGGLNVILKTLLNPEDEVVVFAPYFVEYRLYADNHGGKTVVVPPRMVDFQPNLEEFEKNLTSKTKAVIVNSPNNPTGVVYSEETIKKIAEILRKAQQAFGTNIYLVADEPYRELAYDGVHVPYIPLYYENTIVGYSYSKSLSLPGERIGYLVIPSEAADFENLVEGAALANRMLGFVNAPSLMQRVVARCAELESDVSAYNRNRETLYQGLCEAGYTCVKPQGAFYLFVKSPLEDDRAFCALAKKHHVLIVPGSVFACPGYVRIAYCGAHEAIVKALPKFKKMLAEAKEQI